MIHSYQTKALCGYCGVVKNVELFSRKEYILSEGLRCVLPNLSSQRSTIIEYATLRLQQFPTRATHTIHVAEDVSLKVDPFLELPEFAIGENDMTLLNPHGNYLQFVCPEIMADIFKLDWNKIKKDLAQMRKWN